jgi:TolB-like protein/Flp pilus assembly protein TadD
MPAKLKSDSHLAIAHVLFIDVVGYSKLLVNEQREVVDQLTRVVRKTPQFRKSEAAGKLIRIPLGDGMALVFFQTPEEPVQCAMEIARALKSHPRFRLRMGVHSGPVDQIKDVNDRLNVAGAGINTARRVMDCGDAGHILLSKRVADDLAQDRLWQPMLHDLGEIEVKHGAKLGIVNLYTSELGNPEPPEKLPKLQGAAKPTVGVQGASDVPEKSIAVLPFENLSADPGNTFFADALQDEILTDLSNIADLKVISRTSVMQYKTGVKRNLREIASELGVAHIVEGSVQPAGNRVRVRAQLIDARTDIHLWADRYDRPLDDVFDIQTEIAKAVADQLQAKLSPVEKAAIEQPPTTDLVAYDRYLCAKKLHSTIGTFDARLTQYTRQTIRLLEQAVAHDPTFLLAYCELARAHAYLYLLGADPSPTRIALAEGALSKALQFAPDRGEPHMAAAHVAYWCHRDYDRALAEVAIARPRLPNEPWVFGLPGAIARRRGQFEQCLINLERAAELDPRSFFLLHQSAQTYWLLRRFPDMARFLDRALAVAPTDANTRVNRALVDLEARGDTQPAHEAIQKILIEDPGSVEAVAEPWLYLALCRRDAGAMARAVASLSPEGLAPFNVRMSRSFCEGLAARARGDAAAAEKAFNATRIEMENLLRERPDHAEALCILGMSDAALGRKEDALREGRRAVEILPITKDANAGAEVARNLAITYAWTGEKDLAIKQLEELLPLYGPISYGQLRLHPWWDPLRDDPRFEKIVEEAKQPVALK